MKRLLTPSLQWLLAFVPLSLLGEYVLQWPPAVLFFLSCLSIIPLAGWLGKATEQIAERSGEAVGGLLNATFGNAAELIIALFALQAGLPDLVKASITGSILGNILLVLGASFLAGGLKYPVQRFNPAGARSMSIMLTLASIGLIAPALFHYFGGKDIADKEGDLSLEIAAVLAITYVAGLIFSLKTHKQLFAGPTHEHPASTASSQWSMSRSIIVLLIASAFIAWISEILIGAVEPTAHAFGMTSVFIGVVVVAIIGNAAEHSTAVTAAYNNRMDLSVGIAVGSSTQVALFVAPLLVVASCFVGPARMDLVFTPIEVVAIALSALITEQIASDGESTWFEGVQLISVYIIFALVFYFLPG